MPRKKSEMRGPNGEDTTDFVKVNTRFREDPGRIWRLAGRFTLCDIFKVRYEG